MRERGWGMYGDRPDLDPSDPLRDLKIAAVEALVSVNEVSTPFKDRGLGSFTTSEFAAHLDLIGEETARRSGWGAYYDRIRPLGERASAPTRAFMEAAGVPRAVLSAALEPGVAGPEEAYVRALAASLGCEGGGGRVTGAWFVPEVRGKVAAARVCGMVPGAKFVNAQSLLTKSDSRGRYGGDGSASLFEALKVPPLLVLCDMDAAIWRQDPAGWMEDAIRDRNEDGKPTIYACDATPGTLTEIVARRAGQDAAERLTRAVIRSIGRNHDERRAHTFTL